MEQLLNYSPGVMNQRSDICELLSASFQGINWLFVSVYTIAANVANNEEKIE